MNCGNPIADKWRKYQERVQMRRKGTGSEPTILYIDGTNIPVTPEKQTLDELGLRRDCCRKHFLTNIDLIHKIY
jgi:DNA-directed RNA polymerase I, II, and III subunit RPABC5